MSTETRNITECKIHKLILNPMRSNTEVLDIVALSDERQKLIEWYNKQLTEPYIEEGAPSFECHGKSHEWHKTFKKDSVLEWYNPCNIYCEGHLPPYEAGIYYEWIMGNNLENIKQRYLFI